MSINKKTTSRNVASKAAKVLGNENSSAIQTSLAGSALSQCNKSNQTGKSMEHIASRALESDKYSDLTKTFAASVLSQSNKKR